MDFDEDGAAIPGSYAIATTQIIGGMADGSPAVLIDSAVCDVCGAWASALCSSGERRSNTDDSIPGSGVTRRRVSRRVRVIVYACPAHFDEVMDSLVEEFGFASNVYDEDELAVAVDRKAKLNYEQ